MRYTSILLVILGALSNLGAQEPSRFEVASIRSGAIPKDRVNFVIGSGRVTYRAHTLQELIRRAYGLDAEQLNGPDWTNVERYDIDATMVTGASKDEVAAMLRTLLQERFLLKLRIETKLTTHWVLALAPGGPHLTPADGEDKLDVGTAQMTAYIRGKGSIPSLIYYLSRFVHTGVKDMTGLKGLFLFDVKYPVNPPTPNSGSDLPSSTANPSLDVDAHLFTELEKLGLKLELRKKVPTEYYTIEHAEKEPTAN